MKKHTRTSRHLVRLAIGLTTIVVALGGALRADALAGRLFTVTSGTGMVCEIDPVTGVEISSFNTPGMGVHPGLAFNGTELFYTDATLGVVKVYLPDGTFVRDIAKPGTGPMAGAGLGVSATSLFGVGVGDETITAVDPGDGSFQSSFGLNQAKSALTFAGARGSLFVRVGDSAAIDEVRPDGTVLNTFTGPATVSGLAYSSSLNRLFAVVTGTLYAMDPDTGALLPGYPVVITDRLGNRVPKTGAAAADEIAVAECGNGHVDAGEQCDDGNSDNTDGCTNDCRENPRCDLDVTKTCCLPPPPSPQAFVCSDAKPLDALTLIWNGTQPIRIKAYKGAVGSTLLADRDNIQVGDEVTVTGFAGSPNDVYYEIFKAGTSTKLGTSTFHLSCSDVDMNGPEDCGKVEGDGKGLTGFINQWIFEGFAGNGKVFDCTPPDTNASACVPPLPPPFVCSNAKPLDTLSLVWNGTQPIRIKAYKGAIGSTLLANIDNIQVGDEVTVAGFAGSPNDVYYEIFKAGTSTKLGTSTFHLSCSDVDMNGPEDCGKTEGNGKGLTGFINQWIFAGMSGNGKVLDCTPPPPPGPTDTCRIEVPPPPHCTTKVLALGLRYLGGNCGNSANQQGSAATCSGVDPGAGPISIVITKDADKVTATPSSGISVGDVVTLRKGSGELAKDTQFNAIGVGGAAQSLKFKTDCSKPLNLGDRFGAFEVVSIDRKYQGLVALGGPVEYTYTITNPGVAAVASVMVDDDKLASIPGSPIALLGPGQTVVLRKVVFVAEDTINTVTVTSGSEVCGQDAALVTVTQPQSTLPFVCRDAKPLDTLSLIWNGTEPIRIKAYKGAVGSALLADIDNIQIGNEVTVTGFAGSPNDVYFEIFKAGTSTKLGMSTFHLSCSDIDMNGPEDCGKVEGDGKGLIGLINKWIFAGFGGNGHALVCP